MLLYSIIILLCSVSEILLYNKRYISLISEINITIKVTGYQKVLNSGFSILPYQILINDINQETIQYQYNLNEEYSNITMRWNSQITDCSNMFNGLNIIKIDFSGFDSSKVTRMYEICFMVVNH